MADDIVTRLREEIDSLKVDVQVLRDAADEIERLLDEIKRLRKRLQLSQSDQSVPLTGDCITQNERTLLDDNERLRRERQEALSEIERLREQLEFAHNILGSEAMVWLFHGSDGWQQSNISNLRDPIHAYWARYGTIFKEAHRG